MKRTHKARKVIGQIENFIAGYQVARKKKPDHVAIYKKQADALGYAPGDRIQGVPLRVVADE